MNQGRDIEHFFVEQLSSSDLVRLALAIARIRYPDLDLDHYVRRIDNMAIQVSPRIYDAEPGGERALALIQAMRLDLGMRGNIEDYYDAANSYLNVVIERGTGLPIMLSLVLVAIGQRLGLNVEGVGFPNHFMARYEDEQGTWFLDPFHGAVMTVEDVPSYFMKIFEYSSPSLKDYYFTPVLPNAWAMRILNNLHGAYRLSNDPDRLAKVLLLSLVLEPRQEEFWRELGLVAYRLGDFYRAARALRRYFYLQGHMVLRLPNSSPFPTTPEVRGLEVALWNLLEEIEAACIRWN